MEDSKKGYIMKQAFGQQELHEREALCTQQQPPNCMTICPLHIDIRGICDALKTEDFSKGRELLENGTSFPHIVANICEAPCENACKLNENGEAINIHALERACLEFGKNESKKRFFIPQKNNRVAFLGVDLFTLNAAAELGKKGYEIIIFGEADNLIHSMKSLYQHMEITDIIKDLSIFNKLKATLHFGVVIDLLFFKKQIEVFDAVCISMDLYQYLSKENNCAIVESKAFFAKPELSYINQLSQGKHIAVTIDRFIQNVSLSVGREQEGSYQTTLYTSLEGIAPSVKVPMEHGGYSKDQGIEEARRCIHCECLECVKGCAFLQHYKKYPKQAIREIYNNLSIVMGNHLANEMINSCALCGQCKAICPNDFDLGEVCKLARQTMIKAEKMPASTYEFALQDMLFSNSEGCFVSRMQPDKKESKYLFFPGCQMGASAPEMVKKIYGDLIKRLSGGVGLVLGCCGAIADWSGHEVLFEQARNQMIKAWELQGRPVIITACPSCHKIFQEYTDVPITGIWDVLEEIGLPDMPKVSSKDKMMLAIHDACGARNDKSIRDSIRRIIKNMGYSIEELPLSKEQTPCCGFGGMTSFANREVAKEMTEFCINQSTTPYITYCMNCRDRFVKQGKYTNHLLELIYGENPQSSPSLSKRSENRITLKQTILQELWGEETKCKTYEFKICVDKDVQEIIEARMILESDIMEIIQQARISNNVIKEKHTGRSITSLRIGNVTFWLKYKEIESDIYSIFSAYSHRMTVEED
ncbi:MAG: heterodisulfide reductase-related iron-sulfur binding cluster [Lachnospiraceae bacterium]|nr:heterodisulfide reductase-related iron-sulfur binding cluster [Lachnospiraceae bacterium]